MQLLAPVVLAVAFSLVVPRVVWAQDPLKVAPAMYKLVFENERVRVMEVTFAPGQKIEKHSHPDHYAYVLEGGKLRINKDGAEPAEADLTVGQTMWIPAEAHWAENVGKAKVRLLVTELKEPAPKAAAEHPEHPKKN
jgi:quercetin dioxygenase-like cupin family protein